MTEAQTLQGVTNPLVTELGPLHLFNFPDRFVDTRTGLGGRTGKIKAGVTPDGQPQTPVKFKLAGVTGDDGQLIPREAIAVLATVTATQATGKGFLKVLAGDIDPSRGNPILFFQEELPVFGDITCPLCPNGEIQVLAFQFNPTSSPLVEVHVVVDIMGYYLKKC